MKPLDLGSANASAAWTSFCTSMYGYSEVICLCTRDRRDDFPVHLDCLWVQQYPQCDIKRSPIRFGRVCALNSSLAGPLFADAGGRLRL